VRKVSFRSIFDPATVGTIHEDVARWIDESGVRRGPWRLGYTPAVSSLCCPMPTSKLPPSSVRGRGYVQRRARVVSRCALGGSWSSSTSVRDRVGTWHVGVGGLPRARVHRWIAIRTGTRGPDNRHGHADHLELRPNGRGIHPPHRRRGEPSSDRGERDGAIVSRGGRRRRPAVSVSPGGCVPRPSRQLAPDDFPDAIAPAPRNAATVWGAGIFPPTCPGASGPSGIFDAGTVHINWPPLGGADLMRTAG